MKTIIEYGDRPPKKVDLTLFYKQIRKEIAKEIRTIVDHSTVDDMVSPDDVYENITYWLRDNESV